MTTHRFETNDLISFRFSKIRDTDDDGWLCATYKKDGWTQKVEVGPIPEDMVRDALAVPSLTDAALPYRGLVLDD